MEREVLIESDRLLYSIWGGDDQLNLDLLPCCLLEKRGQQARVVAAKFFSRYAAWDREGKYLTVEGDRAHFAEPGIPSGVFKFGAHSSSPNCPELLCLCHRNFHAVQNAPLEFVTTYKNRYCESLTKDSL